MFFYLKDNMNEQEQTQMEELKKQNKLLEEQQFQEMRGRFRKSFLTTAALGLGVAFLADK